MKKILISLLLVATTLLATEPVLWGVLKGNIKTYYPNITVTNAYLISNSSTTGITASKPQALVDAQNSFRDDFLKSAKESCKDSYGYALDNFQVQYTTFGDYSNTFIYVSANVVCLEK